MRPINKSRKRSYEYLMTMMFFEMHIMGLKTLLNGFR